MADLTALSRFRAILLASGAPARMIEIIPRMNGPSRPKGPLWRTSDSGPASAHDNSNSPNVERLIGITLKTSNTNVGADHIPRRRVRA